MGQMGFCDLSRRYEDLVAMNDPLVKLDAAVPWARFRGRLEAVQRAPEAGQQAPLTLPRIKG